jgi:hypothetical protein
MPLPLMPPRPIHNRRIISAPVPIIQSIMQHILRASQRDIRMAHYLLANVIHTVQTVLVVARPFAQRDFGDEAAADVVLDEGFAG